MPVNSLIGTLISFCLWKTGVISSACEGALRWERQCRIPSGPQ